MSNLRKTGEERMIKQKLTEWFIKRKQFLTFFLISLIFGLSAFSIFYVIYYFFFWQPPTMVDPFWINISNLTQ